MATAQEMLLFAGKRGEQCFTVISLGMYTSSSRFIAADDELSRDVIAFNFDARDGMSAAPLPRT